VIVTIDGPSGAGKGTVCYLLAKKFGFHLLDSGALYRLTALSAENQQVDFADEQALAQVAKTLDVVFAPKETGVQIQLAGIDVTALIRQEHVGMNASKVASCNPVRDALLQRQRDFAQKPGLVADGRDMGTTVFPNAELKIFLTASAQERANRRVMQLSSSDQKNNYEQILASIKLRDEQDINRSISPLKPAVDALKIDCTSMSIDQVLAEISAQARKVMPEIC
jgi:cytidylate kinase